MAKIAFILLCHKDPEAIISQARQLTAAGDCMAIHFDARAKPEDFALIEHALKDNPSIVFARKRIKCGWGEWSLVQATMNAVEAALEAFPRATHFYMVSGDCMAIKGAAAEALVSVAQMARQALRKFMSQSLDARFAGRALEHEFAQGPDPGVDAVGAEARRGAVEIGGHGAHLILQFGKGADVVHPPLLVERRHRFGAQHLAAAGAHRLVTDARIDGAQNVFDHVAAVVHFADNAVR